jgi:SAM-dependent methyltransferase
VNGSAASQSGEATFLDVTELAGAPISGEQLDRMTHRYTWAAQYCAGKDVAELACGTGPGLGMLNAVAASLEAGDYSSPILELARAHYRDRVPLARFDALQMPYAAASKDVLIIFEAIYYLADFGRFIAECRRVLKPGGQVLIATANKDLSDFNPSPQSHRYLGVVELSEEFRAQGFSVRCFGYLAVEAVSMRQRALRPIKRLVVGLGLMPRTMRGKQLLKRLVFGRPIPMPAEIEPNTVAYVAPDELPCDRPDRSHKVIYCVATVGGGDSAAQRPSPSRHSGGSL